MRSQRAGGSVPLNSAAGKEYPVSEGFTAVHASVNASGWSGLRSKNGIKSFAHGLWGEADI